jgi:hypothetical protein
LLGNCQHKVVLMPVEIAILSGAQQGGRWATEAGRVVVGDAETCDIRFDGDLDPGASR